MKTTYNTLSHYLPGSEAAMVFAHSRLAFGFMLKTPDDVSAMVAPASAAILEKPFKLVDGYGMNVITTADNLSTLLNRLANADRKVSCHLLRDGVGQVPGYNPTKMGPTGLPSLSVRLTVPQR